jgi:D-alanyl-D-alanine carboxypeptidase
VLLFFLLVTGLAVKSESADAGGYGHRQRVQASESDLLPAGPYRDSGRLVKLLAPAARAFQQMQQAAQGDGVEIIPISGYRTYDYQEILFAHAVQKHGSKKEAARWVAPPGYSHHHTGLALDLGDRSAPQCDLKSCFRRTLAFAWLRRHAARFGFRVTYSPSRPGTIAEPWHWHFMGLPVAPEPSLSNSAAR